MRTSSALVILTLFALPAFSDVPVQDTQVYADAKLGLTVLKGRIKLPAAGFWQAVEPGPGSGLRQAVLRPSDEALQQMQGERGWKAERMQAIEMSERFLRTIYWMSQRYAVSNNGVGPASLSDLPNLPHRAAILDADVSPSDFFLIPGVVVTNRAGSTAASTNAGPLAIEVRPFVDDGRQWILFDNGRTERRAIDRELAAKYGLTIEPKHAAEPAVAADAPAEYLVLALSGDAGGQPAALVVRNGETGEALTCSWEVSGAAAGAPGLVSEWAGLRAEAWRPMLNAMDAPVLRYWRSRLKDVYGVPDEVDRAPRRFPRGENVDAFSVLSGRAAVRETLQMQSLAGEAQPAADRAVPLSDLATVDVKSHPFEDMLHGSAGGSLAMADLFPPDRAWLYFAKPAALLGILDRGAAFAFNAGSVAAQNRIAYDLKGRYLARLGLTEGWVREVLESGAISELAFSAPDLFFIDGTEITVAARCPARGALLPFLQTLGLPSLSGGITERIAAPGEKVFWVADGDLLLISTRREELETVAALRQGGGAGSLGRSAEFRYMLTQLPVQPATEVFCYLSDPFIRRLVSPQTKIAQLRRLQARAELESLSASALLFRLDGQEGTPTLETLAGKGYVDPSLLQKDYSLGDELVARSAAYGTPAALTSLLANPVDRATPAEAAAYSNYVANYSRFWRQYFDPIAFRMDEPEPGQKEVTTFILPLIDNSLYNGVKGAVQGAEDITPLRIPRASPAPVLQLSLNLGDESWVQITKGFLLEFIGRYARINPQLFDLLGPAVHLAIQDADPVLTFGGGDVLGAFGAPVMGGVRGAQMLYVPMLLSMLTRPCQLLVDVKDADRVIRMLSAATGLPEGSRRSEWEPTVSFYRLEGRDAWICSVDLFGMARIRFGIEVQNEYLILSNIPWSQRPDIRATEEAALNGIQISAQPEAGALQLPGLFTAAAERERAAAAQGIGYLYPLLISGAPTVEEARKRCKVCFGFTPEHPDGGAWSWDDHEVRSTVYGGLHNPVQPDYRPSARAFGVFDGIRDLTLNLQFEDTGLRVKARWSVAE